MYFVVSSTPTVVFFRRRRTSDFLLNALCVLYMDKLITEEDFVVTVISGCGCMALYFSVNISFKALYKQILAIITNSRYGYNGCRSVFIDQYPTYFHHVLNSLRNEGVIDLQTLPTELVPLFQLKRLCVNLRLDGLVDPVNRKIRQYFYYLGHCDDYNFIFSCLNVNTLIE